MSDAGYTCFKDPAQPESRKFSELLKEIWQGSQPLKNQLTDEFCEYNPSTDRDNIPGDQQLAGRQESSGKQRRVFQDLLRAACQ